MLTEDTCSYSLVTPVRDEQENLKRLADSVERQTILPCAWVIVDTGSTDGTSQVASAIVARLPFAHTISIAPSATATRGGPIVRAFHAGVEMLRPAPDMVMKLDADVSFEPDYCERLLDAFGADPHLGVASGMCTELRGDEWKLLFGTRHHVWGASRAYRWSCLEQILPLEQREGWDEIDSIKAQLRGWNARVISGLLFRHHRPEGLRDGSSRKRWRGQGDTAHYMGYRFYYLAARALWRSAQDPAAISMVSGYARAAIRRDARCPDAAVRAHLRREQSLRRLPLRVRESLGRVT